MIHDLVWDLDGTLLDTYPAMVGALAAALVDWGHAVPLERIRELMMVSVGHCARVLADEFRLNADDLMSGYRMHYRSIPALDQRPFPGVREICQHICAIDGKNVIATHRGRASSERLLGAHEMLPFFVDIVSMDEGHPKKPDPALFQVALERARLDQSDTLAIGDREIDIIAAQAAGLRACLYREAPIETSPDVVVGDYADLLELILHENGQEG